MLHDQKVAVAIPAHNEERLIAETIGAVPPFVDVIVVVDDASTDGTLAEIRRAAARDDRVVVLSHARNQGVGAAIVTAYRRALRSGAQVVAVMDGDCQMHPGDLAAVLEPVCSGRADFSKGSRFDGLVPRGRMPLARIIGNVVFSVATRIAGGLGTNVDAQCGYTAISAASLARLPLDILYPRYGFPNDLVLRVAEAGMSIESVPVRAVYGAEVSGIRPHVAVPCIAALLVRGLWRRVRVPRIEAMRRRPIEADEG